MKIERQETNFRFNLSENKKNLHFVMKIGLSFLVLIFLYCIVMTFILQLYSSSASKEAQIYFFEKSPDIIAVFTGDKGRLEYAFKLLEKHPESKLLISGVYNKNTLQSLMNTIPGNFNEEQASQIVELDYHAKNTVENVLMTLQYIKKDPTYKKILIISSDYHLLRIKFLIETFNVSNTTESIQYFGVNSENIFFQKIMDASMEGLKIVRAAVFSYFWMNEEQDYLTTSNTRFK